VRSLGSDSGGMRRLPSVASVFSAAKQTRIELLEETSNGSFSRESAQHDHAILFICHILLRVVVAWFRDCRSQCNNLVFDLAFRLQSRPWNSGARTNPNCGCGATSRRR